MPVTVRSNPYHPTRDLAILTEPWTAHELRQAVAHRPRPLSQKAIPGTDKHRRLLAAGATVYQRCPPLQVDASTPQVRDWCRTHAILPVQDLHDEDLDELWCTWYETIHRDWSPTSPHRTLLELFAPLVEEIDPLRSTMCHVDGVPVAVAFVFPTDDPPEILTEALLPHHARARDAVASCMAAALAHMDRTVRFDGHVTDPHFHPLWNTVPGVYAGANDPLDLVEIKPT